MLVLALLLQTVAAPREKLDVPHVRAPLSHENLAIYLLEAPAAEARLKFITLEEGLRTGKVRVSEQRQASVDQLRVENSAQVACFLQAGDVVKGGKQDRVITADTLLPPRTGATIKAFCVESGRWTGGGAFGSSTGLAGAKLRDVLQGDADQGKVWEAVKEMKDALVKTNALGASRSTSLNEQVLNAQVQKRLAAFQRALGGAIDKNERAVGLVAAVNGKPRTSDVYADPALFRKLYPRLLASAALDAISTPAKDVEPPSPDAVAKMLAAAKPADSELHRQAIFE